MKKFMEYFGEFYAFLGRKPDLKLDEFELEINGECIEGKSICLDTNKAEEWGQCIKYLLTILKFLLTQVLKIEDDAYKSILENAKILSVGNTLHDQVPLSFLYTNNINGYRKILMIIVYTVSGRMICMK